MCFGPFKRACHWGPLIALSIMKLVTISTVSCLSKWYPPWDTYGGTWIYISFMSSSVCTLFFFMQAMFSGPGNLECNWQPENEKHKSFLQFCTICHGYKAPRAHHCKKCGTCNMKMDHHCPWINNCVGHKNHTAFVLFLFFAVIGCSQAMVVISVTLYRAVNRPWYLYYGEKNVPIVTMTWWVLVANLFILGLSIGVVVGVGLLLFYQIRSVVRNRTAIEDWIYEKAIYRTNNQFIYPFDLGRKKNIAAIINWNLKPVGDGISWPVREECDQFTLTMEQLEQKREKRLRSRTYEAISSYSGSWFPCSKGCCVCIHPPITDEKRIRISTGDIIIVTRWKRYWMYGERVTSGKDRGWFPRRCATERIPKTEKNCGSQYEEEISTKLKLS